jgi:hypothetical protein
LFDFPLMLAAAHKRRGKPDPSGGGDRCDAARAWQAAQIC